MANNDGENKRSVQQIKDYWAASWKDAETQRLNMNQMNMPAQIQKNEDQKYHKTSLAVIGVSCRFPKANNVDEFWEMLITKSDGICPLSQERADLLQLDYHSVCNYNCGLLNCPIDEFDAEFFGISPREVELIDPQQRLLLEVAWEALENAAINPHSLHGGSTGIYNGVWRADYENIVKENMEHKVFPKIVLGNSFAATSARLSYILGCNGQNIATESGCSSSMMALNLAYKSLEQKTTDLAIVMGANLFCDVDLFEDAVILSKDGHCKTFDEKADGFGRSEGIAVIVLKRLTDAIANGDQVHAIIRGVGISQEGTSSSFGTPSKHCQEIAIRNALQNARVSPKDVDYVEAHGTGTPTGDPVEFAALSTCYAGERDDPLVVGSVKTNIGNTESVAGLAGLIKVILSLKNETIPPHRNFDILNPAINLKNIPAILPLEQQQWKRSAKRVRIAGINAFGISGTNVHIIVEEPPNATEFEPLAINSLEAERTNHILTLSAKTDAALDDLVHLYIKYLNENPKIDIRDLTFTANNSRAQFLNRLSVIGKNVEQLTEALQKKRPSSTLEEKPKIAFLFSGQGCQCIEMGNILYKSNCVFRSTFNKCTELIYIKTGMQLKNILLEDDGKLQVMQNILALFSTQYALVTLFFSLEIRPDVVMGYGVGNYAAAVASGIIDLDDALTLLVETSKLVSELPRGSKMNVLCPKDKCVELIKSYIESHPVECITVDAVNLVNEIVVAGKEEALKMFQGYCLFLNVECEMLIGSHSFHSMKSNGVLNSLKQTISQIKFEHPNCEYISSITGLAIENDEMRNGSYWLRHLEKPVNFHQGIQTLSKMGVNAFIEMGPSTVLLSLGKRILDSKNILWLPTLQQLKDDWEILLGSLGTLYINKVNINWSAIETPENRKKPTLPTYAFQREKFWMTMLRKNVKKKIHPLLGRKLSLVSKQERIYCNHFSLAEFSYLRDYQIADLVVLPGAVFLEIILAAAKDTLLKHIRNIKYALNIQNFVIYSPLELKEKEQYQIQVVVVEVEINNLQIDVWLEHNGWKKHAGALVLLSDEKTIENKSSDDIIGIEELKSQCDIDNISADTYNDIQKSGLKLGEAFRSLKSVCHKNNETIAIVIQNSLMGNLDSYFYHPVVLDAMFQVMFLTMKTKDLNLYLPTSIEKCLVYQRKFFEVAFAHAKWDDNTNSGTVSLYDTKNELLVAMIGVRFIRTTINCFQSSIERLQSDLPDLCQRVSMANKDSPQSESKDHISTINSFITPL